MNSMNKLEAVQRDTQTITIHYQVDEGDHVTSTVASLFQSLALSILHENGHPFSSGGSRGVMTEGEVVSNLDRRPFIGSSFFRISLRVAVLGCQSSN